MLLSQPVADLPEEPPPPCQATWDGPWPQTALDFEKLIEHFQDRLVRYAYRQLGCTAEAEDVVQEVFVKAFVQRTRLAAVTNVTPYLYRVTANLCTDRRRRSSRQPSADQHHELAEQVDTRPGARERALAEEELRNVNRLLAGLPDHQAEVLRLSVLDELSLSEISEVLGRSVNTIKSRLRYGLDKLRRHMQTRKDTRS